MLDLHRLRVLSEVARLGSMTAAARSLAYTQPAISHHIARLEAQAGTPLLVRHGRGVRLTEAGRLLVTHADAILARLADVEEQVAAIAGLRAGRVRLAAFPTGAASFLPGALAAMHARAPKVEVSLVVEAEPSHAIAALHAGEVDIAVVFTHTGEPPDAGPGRGGSGDGGSGGGGSGDGGSPGGGSGAGYDPQWVAVPLLEDRNDVVLPVDHPAAGSTEVRLASLAGDTWVAGCERCRAHLIKVCEAAGVRPRIAYTTDEPLATQQLVAWGLAVATLPGLAFVPYQQPGLVRLPAPELGYRRIVALVPAGSRPPAVTAMLDELVAAAVRVRPDGAIDPGTGPVSPGPVSPGPVSPAPVSPAPVSPAPVSPAPVSPAPVSPAPVSPAPPGGTAAPVPTPRAAVRPLSRS